MQSIIDQIRLTHSSGICLNLDGAIHRWNRNFKYRISLTVNRIISLSVNDHIIIIGAAPANPGHISISGCRQLCRRFQAGFSRAALQTHCRPKAFFFISACTFLQKSISAFAFFFFIFCPALCSAASQKAKEEQNAKQTI